MEPALSWAVAWDSFTPLSSLLGGLLIGAAASVMLLLLGRIAGISGILGGLLSEARTDRSWRVMFILGLLVGGLALAVWAPDRFGSVQRFGTVRLVVAGLLVGFGTRLGGGCTSGHGVCGMSRISKRSMVATGVFMGVAMATVAVMGGVA